jgi:hypothetical protein
MGAVVTCAVAMSVLLVLLYRDAAEFLGRAHSFYSGTLIVAGPGPWNDGYDHRSREQTRVI